MRLDRIAYVILQTVVLYGLTFALAGCGKVRVSTQPKGAEPDLSSVVTFVGMDGLAHGCPVSPSLILTARHVALNHHVSVIAPNGPSTYAYSQGNTGGYATYVAESPALDLALMKVDGPVSYYEVGEVGEGDRVWLVDFDRGNDTPFQSQVVSATVKTVLPHHILLSDFGQPGASGGCVLNSVGKVVGIYVAFIQMYDMKSSIPELERFGLAVSVQSEEVSRLVAQFTKENE